MAYILHIQKDMDSSDKTKNLIIEIVLFYESAYKSRMGHALSLLR